MFAYLRKVTRRDQDRGASAVEYGLMVAAIAALIVGVVFALGNTVSEKFDQTKKCIDLGASAPGPCPSGTSSAPTVP